MYGEADAAVAEALAACGVVAALVGVDELIHVSRTCILLSRFTVPHARDSGLELCVREEPVHTYVAECRAQRT